MIMIRKAVPEDAEQIEKLYSVLESDAVSYQPQHFVMSPAGARSEQLKSILSSETQTMLAAEYRSRGIGTLLLNAAKEYGREKGAEFFRTQVFPLNEDGLRFYRRNGFEVTMLTIECPL